MAFVQIWDGREWFECDRTNRGRRCSCKIDYPAAVATGLQPERSAPDPELVELVLHRISTKPPLVPLDQRLATHLDLAARFNHNDGTFDPRPEEIAPFIGDDTPL